MKRLVTVFYIAFLALITMGQGKFTVPVLTDLQKYQNAALQWNGSYLIQISYAKSLGKSVEDVAKFFGDQLIATWNKQSGFDGLVRGILYTMVCLVPYGSVEIIEQTDNGIKYKVTGLYSDLREGGSIFNVTYKEYIKFWEIAISKLANDLRAKYSQTDTDEGLIATLGKK